MLTCLNLALENNYNTVFHKLSFTAITGSLIIVNGPNGSGKTSLLKMLAGLIPSSIGSITWNNIDINHNLNEFRKNICFISDKNALNDECTVYDNLFFWTQLRGEKELFIPAIHYFKLEHLLDVKFGHLSSGLKRRVELAKLLLYKTHLWLLDEPDINLDNALRNTLIDLIKVRIKEGGVVIMTTHNKSDLDFASFIDLEDFKK